MGGEIWWSEAVFVQERVAASGLCRASSSFRVPSGTSRRVGWRRLARLEIAVYCEARKDLRGVAAAAIGRTWPSLGPRILQSSSRFAESSSLASGRGGPVRVPSGTGRPPLRGGSVRRKGAESVAMLRIAGLCGAAEHSNRGFAEPQGGGRKAELSPSVTNNQAVRFRLSRPNRDPPTGGEAGGTDSTGEASDEVNSLKTDPRKKRNLCRLPATEVPRNEVKSDKIVLLRPAVSASWPPGLAPPSPPQYPRSFVPPGLAPASWPPWSRPPQRD